MTRFALLSVLTGCSQILGISDPSSSPPSDDQPPLDGSNMPGDGSNSKPSTCTADPGMPHFGTAVLSPVTGAVAFDVAEINNDAAPGVTKFPDIAVSTQTDTVLLLNDGKGGFGPNRQLRLGTPVASSQVLIQDFDGEHNPDVVSVQGEGTQSFQVNTRDKAFSGLTFDVTAQFALPAGEGVEVLLPIDLMAGLPGIDVVIGTTNGNSVIYSEDAGAMVDRLAELPGVPCGSFDVDGDKFGDLVVTDGGTGATTLLFGDGAGGFTPVHLADEPECHTAIGALDDSGMPSIIGGDGTHLDVFHPGGSASFSRQLFFSGISVPKGADRVQVLDVNGDGRDDVFSDGDLVLACAAGPRGVPAEPDGEPFHLATHGGHARLVDLNQDGKPDLVVMAQGGILVSLQE